MKEIEEVYCSFEVAKLLKEKGFKEFTLKGYDITGKELDGITPSISWNEDPLIKQGFPNFKTFAKSTHQMACAWIRKKGYSVEVHVTPVGWHWEVCTVGGTLIASNGACDDYDKCMENALMYALNNLI